MSTNRIHNFMKNILFNSKLNREKSINNKIKYSNLNIKNKKLNNLIIKRNISTATRNNKNNQENCSENGGNGPNNYMYFALMAFGTYFMSGKFNKNKF